MNWDDLKLFLAVARSGSISGAAKLLDVQHSTVSRRIRHLEKILGARLLERKKTGYELTEAGENIKDAACRIETEVFAVDAELSGKDAHLTGSLKVAAINNMATTVLMPMFSHFNKVYPQIELNIIVSNNDVSLSQREADIAIRLTNSPTDTLIGKKVVNAATTVYGSRAYLNEIREKKEEPKWIGVECCSFHIACTKKHRNDQPYSFISDDTLLTLAAIKEDLGLSFLPCFMGDADPQLERYCDPLPENNLGLWILLHPDLKRTERVLTFRNYMIDAINEQKELFEGILLE